MKVMALGTFDILHEGHVRFLERCRRIAGPDGQVVIGLNSDEFAASYKRPPAVPWYSRATALRACRHVDIVLRNDQDGGSALGLIESVAPDAIVTSMDWFPTEGRDWFVQIGVPRSWFQERGVLIVWAPYTAGISTTDILARLSA